MPSHTLFRDRSRKREGTKRGNLHSTRRELLLLGRSRDGLERKSQGAHDGIADILRDSDDFVGDGFIFIKAGEQTCKEILALDTFWRSTLQSMERKIDLTRWPLQYP